MIGTRPSVARYASRTACSCGTPAPVSSRVRQPRPGPTPTLIASTPSSVSRRAASAVATLPTTSGTFATFFRSSATACATVAESAWATSSRSTSTSCSTSACARSRKSPIAPTAAPTRNRPRASLVECGFCL